ncbi:MAG: cupin domain-containing protein [Bacteroidota bacterium]
MDEGNIFAGIPPAQEEEHLQVLLCSGAHRIERIVSRGHISPPGFWYDQETAEWVMVLGGEAVLEFPTGSVRMGPGDYLFLPPRTKHRVAWTDPSRDTLWLAVHLG